MTNQDYMDLLERFSQRDSTIRMKVEYSGNDTLLRYFVETDVYYYPTDNFRDASMDEVTVIEIMDGILLMPMPNIMDAHIAKNTSGTGIRQLYQMNVNLGRDHTLNQYSSSQLTIPYYPDESERFQRELMGEIVLYESHLQYVHKIVQKAHDNYMKVMKNTWDKAIIL